MDTPLAAIRAVLATTPARWQSLIAALPAELLSRPPLEGEWSALDCLRHLAEAETAVFPVRVQKILAGEDFDAFDPDAAAARSEVEQADVLVRQFMKSREASLAIFDQLTSNDLSRTARHAELGQVTLAELLNEWAGHDLMHTVQAERSLMQPFIAGCGPWHSYFTDHVA
jgi:hypothetical protein